MRVLYVEDNPANVFLVKRVAKMGQHEIINFIDGREAIRKYDDVNPDLVLMDIQLVGETSGLEVVKELRAKGVTTPIIAVTAYAMVGDKERCIEAGCNDYLAKPLPIPRLIEIFQEYEASVKAKAASAPASPVSKSDELVPVVAGGVVVTPEPKPETLVTEPTKSPETAEVSQKTAIGPAAQVVAEPVVTSPTVEPVAQVVAEPITTVVPVEPVAEVKADIHKVETKRITEETAAVVEAKADNAVSLTPPVIEKAATAPETVQVQQPSTSTISTSIHEDVTLPEKSTVQDSAKVETPKTEASG
jgi:CheY-like chemotaxis protein